MLQGLRCVRCGCEFYAESAETCGLVILACSDLSAYTTSPKSLPPARPSRAKMVGIVLSFVSLCQSRKDRHLLARTSVRPAPDAPVGLSARSAEDRKNDAGASPFQTSSEPSGGICTRSGGIDDCSVFARPKVITERYKYYRTAALSRSGWPQAALSIMDFIQSYGLYGIGQIISYLRVAVEYIIDVPLSYL